MTGEGAAGAIARAIEAALRRVPGLAGASDGDTRPAVDARPTIDIGTEIDWGHKNGAGAEIRFSVMIRCGGEAPGRARRQLEAARQAIEAMPPALEGWRLVSLALQRARTLREPGPRWTGVVEYRARLLATKAASA